MKHKRYRSGIIRKTKDNSYQADISIDKKRYRKNVPDIGKARAFIDNIHATQDLDLPALNASQMIDAGRAYKILPDGVSLTEIARHYVQSELVQESITLKQGFDYFLEAKKKANLRTATIAEYRQSFARWSTYLGNPFINEITTDQIVKIDWKNYSPITIENNHRNLKVFMNYAIKRGWTAKNPLKAIDKPKVDQTLAQIMSIKETATLLYAAQEIYPRILPEMAIGFFLGIRPKELNRLTWDCFRNGHIYVGGSAAKIRSQRYVDIPENLFKWIEIGNTEHRICRGAKEVRRKERQEIVKLIGYKEWPKDVMRHSYASYHLACYQDAAATSLQLGHSDQEMLFKHYRNLVTKEEGEEYFGLTAENSVKHLSKSTIEKIQVMKNQLSKK